MNDEKLHVKNGEPFCATQDTTFFEVVKQLMDGMKQANAKQVEFEIPFTTLFQHLGQVNVPDYSIAFHVSVIPRGTLNEINSIQQAKEKLEALKPDIAHQLIKNMNAELSANQFFADVINVCEEDGQDHIAFGIVMQNQNGEARQISVLCQVSPIDIDSIPEEDKIH